MGNCSHKCYATFKQPSRIRVLTESGRLMELQAPKLAREVLDDFPGYGIFRRGQASLPLFDDEQLHGGQIYFLVPFGVSASAVLPPALTPMAKVSGAGVWTVNLAVSAEDLKAMLSEGAKAEAVIGKIRVAAGGAKDGRMWKSHWIFGHRRSAIPASVLEG